MNAAKVFWYSSIPFTIIHFTAGIWLFSYLWPANRCQSHLMWKLTSTALAAISHFRDHMIAVSLKVVTQAY
jgi:hypothetical protein